MSPGSATNDKAAEARRGDRPAPLSEYIYQQLYGQIANGELKHNARLPGEHQLAEKYGVSRPVVRDALKRLRDEGLIESRQGAGSWVTFDKSPAVPSYAPIGSIADIRRCYEFRIAVERETAYLAAQRAAAKPLADIEAALALMDIATREHVHSEEADFSFHYAIAVAADNHYLSSSLLGIRDHISVVMTLHGKSLLASHPGLEQVFAEHRNIFIAIRDGDALRASRLMEEHLIGSRDRLFGVAEHAEPRPRLELSTEPDRD
jgi:GntR family transcriptional repressor for pyruvate dehydrogenase complex